MRQWTHLHNHLSRVCSPFVFPMSWRLIVQRLNEPFPEPHIIFVQETPEKSNTAMSQKKIYAYVDVCRQTDSVSDSLLTTAFTHHQSDNLLGLLQLTATNTSLPRINTHLTIRQKNNCFSDKHWTPNPSIHVPIYAWHHSNTSFLTQTAVNSMSASTIPPWPDFYTFSSNLAVSNYNSSATFEPLDMHLL